MYFRFVLKLWFIRSFENIDIIDAIEEIALQLNLQESALVDSECFEVLDSGVIVFVSDRLFCHDDLFQIALLLFQLSEFVSGSVDIVEMFV